MVGSKKIWFLVILNTIFDYYELYFLDRRLKCINNYMVDREWCLYHGSYLNEAGYFLRFIRLGGTGFCE